MSHIPSAFIYRPPRSSLYRLVWGSIQIVAATTVAAIAATAVVYPSIAHVYRPTAHVDLNDGRCIKVVNHLPTTSATCSDYEKVAGPARGERFNVVMDFDSGSIVK